MRLVPKEGFVDQPVITLVNTSLGTAFMTQGMSVPHAFRLFSPVINLWIKHVIDRDPEVRLVIESL